MSTNNNLNPGPTTLEGKAISSRNSLKHGCCADTLILKSENIEDYQALEALWVNSYLPDDDAERHLIQELVNADWFLQRATRTVANIEAELFEAEPNPLRWTEENQKTLGRFLRYQTTRANNVKRCQKAVDDYRKNCAAEIRAETKDRMAQERHALQQERNKPEPTVAQLIQNMLREKREREESERLAQQNQSENL